MNKGIKIAFDCDGTLFDKDLCMRIEIVSLLFHFQRLGCDIIIWSGGGVSFAEHCTRRLGLEFKVRVITKGSELVDIAVDDMDVKLGKINIKV